MLPITEVMENRKVNLKSLARFVQCHPEPMRKSERRHKDSQQSFHVNVVVLGSTNCGKTAVIKRFLGQPFPVAHIPTLEDVYDGHYTLKAFQTTVLLRIYDTDGSFRFPAMRHLAITEGQAFIIMFELNSKESFDRAIRTLDEVIKTKGNNVPVYLVGNKCDLPASEQVITTQEAIRVSNEKKCCFTITSAKQGINTDKIFREIASRMVEKRLLDSK